MVARVHGGDVHAGVVVANAAFDAENDMVEHRAAPVAHPPSDHGLVYEGEDDSEGSSEGGWKGDPPGQQLVSGEPDDDDLLLAHSYIDDDEPLLAP